MISSCSSWVKASRLTINFDAMFAVNPDNRYLDVGSALDEVVLGRASRPYMDATSGFSMHISRF